MHNLINDKNQFKNKCFDQNVLNSFNAKNDLLFKIFSLILFK